jgi:cobalt-zinc-cadmium efflux system protein
MSGEHPHPAERPIRVLALGLGLTLGFAGVEALVGWLSGSLALVADAGHMLVDSAGLVLALVAAQLARRPVDASRTYGYARAEVVVVPLHVVFMFALSGYILYESIQRFGSGEAITAVPVLITGVIGLAVNLLVFRLIHDHAETNLNVRGASLEVLSDAIGSVAVIVTAAVALFADVPWLDPLAGLAIGAWIIPRAVRLLREAVDILLEGVPRGVDVGRIATDVSAVPGVVGMHDVHVWALAPSFVSLSAHVEVETMSDAEDALAGVAELLARNHHIQHVTLQPETSTLHEVLECCGYPDSTLDHRPAAVSGYDAHVPSAHTGLFHARGRDHATARDAALTKDG